MVVDTVSDMFTRIRNANLKLHERLDISLSKLKLEVARILKEEGYIANYKKVENSKQGVLRIYLKYTSDGSQVIQGLKRSSKPSLRVYKGYKNIPRTIGGLGITIVSTSSGLMTDKRARNRKIGGEILGYVW
ncbi:MAG: 30S ribosomal protein S8 [Elusimicrobiota bacterium]|jgi:small subunit ribosomal protein S8|nr:30S ribosomal protein S8 [Elusimicrobiota bacterium]